MLTSFFYKSLFKEAAELHPAEDDLRVLLTHAKEVWFPETLGSLQDQEKFILELLESLKASLDLLLYLFFFEARNAPDLQILYQPSFVSTLNPTYFEPILHALSPGYLQSQPQAV